MTGMPRAELRVEGLVLLVVGMATFRDWSLHAALFPAPDVAGSGYLACATVGADAHSVLHFIMIPVALAGLGNAIENQLLCGAATIWIAHMGFDRTLGYGFKNPTVFGHTHLGRIGLSRTAA